MLAHGERNLTRLGLAELQSLLAALDPVIERIAKQVLERAHELLQHGAVELDLRSANFQIRALVEFLRGLTHDPVQPFGQACERNGADREQLLLNVPRQARLCEQCGIRIIDVPEERLLHGRDVVDAFGEAPRQLLESCEAIEFQRIEVSLARLDERSAGLDLRLGLDLDLAYLRAQADHAVGELEQVALERAQLAFDAGARNRHLAGLVDQPIDKIGAHAQHGRSRRLGFGGRGGCFRRAHRDRMRHERCHDCARSGHRLRGARRARRRFLRHEPRQRSVDLAFLQAVEHKGDAVEVGIERVEELGRRLGPQGAGFPLGG